MSKKTHTEYMHAYFAKNVARLHGTQRCIRDARKARGYTQQELARLIGVAQPNISCWERDMIPADWARLYTILPELEGMR